MISAGSVIRDFGVQPTPYYADIVNALAPMLGKISLTSIPLLPYFLKVNGDFISPPVLRSVPASRRHRAARDHFFKHRLGIEAIDLRKFRPFMNKKDDVLGFGV